MRKKAFITFNGIDGGTRGEQRVRERAKTGADLNHRVAGGDARERKGFVHDITVDEKILTERSFRVMTQRYE